MSSSFLDQKAVLLKSDLSKPVTDARFLCVTIQVTYRRPWHRVVHGKSYATYQSCTVPVSFLKTLVPSYTSDAICM